MDDQLDVLEKEVACLRELFTHLKLEEASLIKGVTSQPLQEELMRIQKNRLSLQKQRKLLFLENVLSKEAPEVLIFLEQIESLREKIREQRKINLLLKKKICYPLPQIKTVQKPKKKPLLLEDA